MSHPAERAFEQIYVEANGIRFRVHRAGSGDRIALLLHGFPELWFSWRDQIPMLVELGYQVWAPDLRGYGGTERPRGVAEYGKDKLLADVAGLVDAAKPRELLLMAHDWGGAIAWDFVAQRIRPVDRFVVMNMPHPKIFARHLRKLGPQLLRSWYMAFFQLPLVPEWILGRDGGRGVGNAFRNSTSRPDRFPEEVLEVYQRAAIQPGALTAMVNYYRAALRGGGLGSGKGGLGAGASRDIETPTLLLWGEDDKVLGRELTEGTEKYVRDLTLRFVPRASHWVQQDQPEIVNAMVKAWLTGERVPEASELPR